ncbi:response regulator [Sunxiuqinia indica]|uniref:response regulator n=1 Tax=Sunxiuqinia indica TaxID=2692584 RepID=UPI0013598855|nr:response regulator [Sunxiuqinia indica]
MSENLIHILVAEDEEFNFLYLVESLSEFNIKLYRAKDGLSAVKMCQENPHFDQVLMDIRMPVMDGYTATNEIKKFRPNLPIIAQTAYAMESDKRKAFEEGCDDYISKPIRRQVLIDIIAKYAPERCPLKNVTQSSS